MLSSPRALRIVAAMSAVGQLVVPAPAHAQSTLAAPLCSIIKQLLPEVRTYKPEGARAQLVMLVAEKFDYDAVKLRQVRAEIDTVTTASCPKDREAMLAVLKTKSLGEALS